MSPTTWSIVAVVFITLFLIVLLGSALVVRYLCSQRTQSKDQDSSYWLDSEQSAASRSGKDALTIASLEAQLSVQERYNAESDVMIELLERNQKHLTLELRDERRKKDLMDPEVYQRVHDEMHRPMSPPRPSLPPLIVNTTSSLQNQIASASPCVNGTTPILPQITKLRDVMQNNLQRSPERTTQVMSGQAEAFNSLEISGTIVDPFKHLPCKKLASPRNC